MADEIIVVVSSLLFSGLIHHVFVIRLHLFSFLSVPVDAGYTFRSKPIFGHRKTFRGFIVMIILPSFFLALFVHIFRLSQDRFIYPAYITGALLGLAYSLGELPTSFLKRQSGIQPSGHVSGTPGWFFYVLEHIDSVSAVMVALPFLFILSPKDVAMLVFAFAAGVVLHISIDIALYRWGYKKGNVLPPVLRLFQRKRN